MRSTAAPRSPAIGRGADGPSSTAARSIVATGQRRPREGLARRPVVLTRQQARDFPERILRRGGTLAKQPADLHSLETALFSARQIAEELGEVFIDLAIAQAKMKSPPTTLAAARAELSSDR